MTTVNATREANQEQLIAGIVDRANKHLRRGISVIEVKSGYGLTVDDELKNVSEQSKRLIEIPLQP